MFTLKLIFTGLVTVVPISEGGTLREVQVLFPNARTTSLASTGDRAIGAHHPILHFDKQYRFEYAAGEPWFRYATQRSGDQVAFDMGQLVIELEDGKEQQLRGDLTLLSCHHRDRRLARPDLIAPATLDLDCSTAIQIPAELGGGTFKRHNAFDALVDLGDEVAGGRGVNPDCLTRSSEVPGADCPKSLVTTRLFARGGLFLANKIEGDPDANVEWAWVSVDEQTDLKGAANSPIRRFMPGQVELRVRVPGKSVVLKTREIDTLRPVRRELEIFAPRSGEMVLFLENAPIRDLMPQSPFGPVPPLQLVHADRLHDLLWPLPPPDERFVPRYPEGHGVTDERPKKCKPPTKAETFERSADE